jgi:hypothetical protein
VMQIIEAAIQSSEQKGWLIYNFYLQLRFYKQ